MAKATSLSGSLSLRRQGEAEELEVHGVGEKPATSPGESPALENVYDPSVESRLTAERVLRHVHVDSHPPRVVRDSRFGVEIGEPGIETAAEVARVEKVTEAASSKLLQRCPKLGKQ